MKNLLICAMAGALVACGGGSGGVSGPITAEAAAKMDPADLVDRVVADMTAAKEMMDGIQTVEDAEAAQPELAEIGERYTVLMTALRDLDQSRIKNAETFMQKQMQSADALAGFMNSLNALQARNVQAAQVIMPELQHFRPT
ncbi:MAG: hypothetical protein WBF53_02560 [Litorimonas sp.]